MFFAVGNSVYDGVCKLNQDQTKVVQAMDDFFDIPNAPKDCQDLKNYLELYDFKFKDMLSDDTVIAGTTWG